MKISDKKITLKTRLAYGGANLLGSGALAISSVWLLFFYTRFCGLSIIQATLIFSIGTYLDVIINPIMGFVTDNFNNTKIGQKFGRRRFFILISIPLMVLYPLMWLVNMSFFYYLFTYIAFEIVYTMVMIPYETLAVEMTNDFEERTYITGYKAIFGKIANFLAASIPGLFFKVLGQDNPHAFLYTAITYCVILIIALTSLYLNSWEKSVEEVKVEHVANLGQGLKKLFIDISSTFRIKTFRMHIGMYLFGFGAEWLFSATFTYFIVFTLNHPTTLVSELNSMGSILQLISTILFISICAKKGFKQPFIYALSIVIMSVVSYCLIYFFNLSHLTWLIVSVTVFFGIGTGGVYYIPWTVYTFLADVDELVTGRRREGVYAASMTMSGKLIRASIVFLLGVILEKKGFIENSSLQPVSVVNGIIDILIFGVCGLALIAIFFSNHLKLNHETHQVLLNELNRVQSGGSMKDVTIETRKICEELTGFSYEKCFGNNNVGYQGSREKTEKHK